MANSVWDVASNICRLVVGIVILVGGLSHVFAGESLEDISEAYKRHRSQIESLLVAYSVAGESLVDDVNSRNGEPLGDKGSRKFSKEVVEVTQGKKLYQRSVFLEMPNMQKAYAALRADRPDLFKKNASGALGRYSGEMPLNRALIPYIPKAPRENSELVRIFDGEVIREKLPQRSGPSAIQYTVKAAETANFRWIGVFYLDDVFLGVDDPGMPPAGIVGSRFKIPEMFSAATFTVAQDEEVIDGHRCVRVESMGYQRLYLDPALGFAVRRCDAWFEGELTYTAEYSDFIELLSELWLPRRITRYRLGTGKTPAHRKGARLVKREYTIKELEVNKSRHADYFILTPPAGAVVVDKRVRPLKEAPNVKPAANGAKRVIAYVQPADAKDVERAIEEARVADSMGLQMSQMKQATSGRWKLVIAAVNIVLLLVAVHVIRRRRKGEL